MNFSYLSDNNLYTIILENINSKKKYLYRIIYTNGKNIKIIINKYTDYYDRYETKNNYKYNIVSIFDDIISMNYLKDLFLDSELIKVTKIIKNNL